MPAVRWTEGDIYKGGLTLRASFPCRLCLFLCGTRERGVAICKKRALELFFREPIGRSTCKEEVFVEFVHKSVLLDEVIDGLAIKEDGIYVCPLSCLKP